MDGAGWTDLQRPPLRQQALRRALTPPSGPFRRLDVVPRVGSTNAELLESATGDPDAWPDLSVLTTDHQQAGRGRRTRTWEAPPRAALAVSVLLRPSVPRQQWSWLSLLTGTGVAEALARVGGLEAGVKWPNDVLVADSEGRRSKVCGVLAEVAPTAVPAVVVGFGVNVTQSQEELPFVGATSLRLAGAATVDRDTVLRAVLRELAAVYATWAEADGDVAASGLAARVRETCWTLGSDVRVELPGGRVLDGVAEELDAAGRLVVRDAAGAAHAVAAGDVVHARLAAP